MRSVLLLLFLTGWLGASAQSYFSGKVKYETTYTSAGRSRQEMQELMRVPDIHTEVVFWGSSVSNSVDMGGQGGGRILYNGSTRTVVALHDQWSRYNPMPFSGYRSRCRLISAELMPPKDLVILGIACKQYRVMLYRNQQLIMGRIWVAEKLKVNPQLYQFELFAPLLIEGIEGLPLRVELYKDTQFGQIVQVTTATALKQGVATEAQVTLPASYTPYEE